jgi:dATP pyrophosphohydrolase
VPDFRSDHVEVYLFRCPGRRVEFLTLRRARGRLKGVWQPVTGTRKRGESALAAARREVREETGIAPKKWWRLEEVALFFDARHDSFQLVPRFAAEIAADEVVHISEEHDAWAFLSAAVATRRYLWASQRRALAVVRMEIVPGGATARALALEVGARSGRNRMKAKTRTRRR